MNLKDLTKLWKMTRAQRIHTEKRIAELENNVREYTDKRNLARNSVDHWDFQLNKTIKELEKIEEALK